MRLYHIEKYVDLQTLQFGRRKTTQEAEFGKGLNHNKGQNNSQNIIF